MTTCRIIIIIYKAYENGHSQDSGAFLRSTLLIPIIVMGPATTHNVGRRLVIKYLLSLRTSGFYDANYFRKTSLFLGFCPGC